MSDENEDFESEFEKIINNQPDSVPDDDEESDADDEVLGTIWDAIEHLWPHYYQGMLIKGVLLAEYIDPIDGGKVMRFISSPEVTPWELLGMLESARLDAREISRACTVGENLTPDYDDDEDE